MPNAKEVLECYGSDLEEIVLHEFPGAVIPGPSKAFVRSAIEDFARRLRASMEAHLRGRIESYVTLHSLFWQQALLSDDSARLVREEFLVAARTHSPEVFRRRGDDLLSYVAKYNRPGAELDRPPNLPPDEALPPVLSALECKHGWYVLDAILEFLLLVAEEDRTLATWPEYAKRPGTRRDRLGRVLKDRVKYSPKNLKIVQQMRSLHGWEIVLSIGQVLDSSRYTHVEGVTLSSVERATYSQMLSVLQGRGEGLHIWPEHIGLLHKIARGKARDYANEELRKRGLTLPLIGDPGLPDDTLTDSDEIDQIFTGAEDKGFEHVFSRIDLYKSQLSEIDRKIVEGIFEGQSTMYILRSLRITKARVSAVARHLQEFLNNQIDSPS